MYHRIANVAEESVPPYYRIATSPARFARQMQWIAEAGWRAVGVSEALRLFVTTPAKARRICALTFDDGFRDFDLEAAPVLRRHGFRATVYLPTAFVGPPRHRFKTAECLTWDEVRALHREGIEFGSHTVSHPQLHRLPWADTCRELAAAKRRIEQELQTEIDGFAYPYAYPQSDRKFRRAFTSQLRTEGHRHAVTTMIGRARPDCDPLCLPRLPVNEADDRALLLAKLAGAYDWVAAAQSVFKSVHRVLAPSPGSAPQP